MSEKFSAMRNPDDPIGSSDSLRENQGSPSLEQLNYRVKQQKNQRKSREKIDDKEHQKADEDLENDITSLPITSQEELNTFLTQNFPNNSNAIEISQTFFDRQNLFGLSITKNELKEKVNLSSFENKEISTADKIKNFKEGLTEQGKSQTEILQILISKFENDEAVSKWTKNWKSYLKLHQFAQNKPPQERKAIERIIAKADFSDENSFTSSLTEITQSSEISNETKLEISREFNGAKVSSIDDMDSTLKEIKSYKSEIEKSITEKNNQTESLDSEIDNLEEELKGLPLGDPKRKELEKEIEQKNEVLKQTKSEIDSLKKAKPENVSFAIREGFSAKLNEDGSRSIQILNENFAIKLPSNFLPFTGNKKLRGLNVAFSYLALREQNIADEIFSPNLENNSVPTKPQRDMSHLILSSLGLDDKRILSESDIKQLKTDMARFSTLKNGKTSTESLAELGIFDVGSQQINKTRFEEILMFIRKNRGLDSVSFRNKKSNI